MPLSKAGTRTPSTCPPCSDNGPREILRRGLVVRWRSQVCVVAGFRGAEVMLLDPYTGLQTRVSACDLLAAFIDGSAVVKLSRGRSHGSPHTS